MKTVNIYEAKTRLSALISAVESGETVILCRNGKPVADLTAHKPKRRNFKKSPFKSIKIMGDINAPAVPAKDWEALS